MVLGCTFFTATLGLATLAAKLGTEPATNRRNVSVVAACTMYSESAVVFVVVFGSPSTSTTCTLA
jgi:hypothetical protein